MFGHLLESGARARSRSGWTLTSAAAHASLIALAVALTLSQPPAIVEPARPERVFFAAPRVPQATRPPIDASAPSWHAPREIPVAIPPMPEVVFPADAHLRSIGQETRGLVIGVGPGTDLPSIDRVYTEHLVEKVVVPKPDNPRPVYPAALSAALVEGEVLVRFVVDTAGRVESKSIVILQATHALFAVSVQHWLTRTRYAPAEVGGHDVRQLVQQKVGFTLRP